MDTYLEILYPYVFYPCEGGDMDLITREFQTVKYVTGSLIFVKAVKKVSLMEMVEILMPDGTKRRGRL